jgi:filamentous hemagglutinin family protein
MQMKTPLLFPLLIFSLSVPAQITTDGTLGPAQNLPGPDYQIGAFLGQQRGGNLFHSFQDFNLQSWESATFFGPNHIQNVISRVTGGNPSRIDGLFRSTIPGANVYFLNPYGIMFGPNARLDVQGSFHASTADYLRLGDGGRFDARNPSDSLLTVAPIESFGFLTHTPSSLSMKDTQLSQLPTTTFSLIGGDLDLKNTQLAIPSGRFNLTSVAEIGEISASTFTTDTKKQGTIKIFDNSVIDVSSLAAGAIAINGGDLLLKNSFLRANAYGDFDGLGIDLNLTESVDILQTYVIDNEIFAVTNQNFGGGSVTGINIKTPILSLYRGGISTTSFGAGQGGYINIETGQMLLDLGASVATGSIGSGDAGHININAQQSLSLLGQNTGHFSASLLNYLD